MKNPFESSETFTAYSTMQAAYFQLKLIQEESMSKSGIIGLIDKQTGYQDEINKKAQKATIETINVIVEQKKILEMDYSDDLEFIEKLNNIYSS